MKRTNRQFPALTGIRAIAAGMVFFHHLNLRLKPEFLMGLQRSFYSGVTLFFVLSGFLITYRYYEQTQWSGRWLKQYFLNRFSRIYPVYFLALTIVLFLLKNRDPIFLIQNYTLTHNLFFVFRSHGMAIDPTWSLTVEECFYLLAPLIFLLTKRWGLWLPFLLQIPLLVFLAMHYGLFAICSGTYFGRFLEFYAGAFLALHLLKHQKNGVIIKTRWIWTSSGVLGSLIVAALLTYASGRNEHTKQMLIIIGNNLLFPFPLALLYYGLTSERTTLAKLLASPFFGLLGRSSYAFYVIHRPVINYLGKPYIQTYLGDNRYNLYVLLMLTIVIILSIAMFILYESPLNRLIRQFPLTRPPENIP